MEVAPEVGSVHDWFQMVHGEHTQREVSYLGTVGLSPHLIWEVGRHRHKQLVKARDTGNAYINTVVITLEMFSEFAVSNLTTILPTHTNFNAYTTFSGPSSDRTQAYLNSAVVPQSKELDVKQRHSLHYPLCLFSDYSNGQWTQNFNKSWHSIPPKIK